MEKPKLANPPTAERILSILADLYADQMAVKITYRVEGGNDEKKAG